LKRNLLENLKMIGPGAAVEIAEQF